MRPYRRRRATMQTVTHKVDAADAGARIDKYLAERADLTRSAAVRLLEEGDVSVGGASVSKNYKVKAGDEIEIRYPEPEPDTALPEDIPLDVVYEDADIIVINTCAIREHAEKKALSIIGQYKHLKSVNLMNTVTV